MTTPSAAAPLCTSCSGSTARNCDGSWTEHGSLVNVPVER
jgi:3-mercaptopyruvate sulfurtransferase SseA